MVYQTIHVLNHIYNVKVYDPAEDDVVEVEVRGARHGDGLIIYIYIYIYTHIHMHIHYV